MKHRKGSHKRRRVQRGGAGSHGEYGYTAAVPTSSGAPYANRDPMAYSNCGWDNARSTPPDISRFMTTQFGGSRRKSRKQRGGGCGCMAYPPMIQTGGGGGTGGYAFDVSNNSLGKVFAGYDVRGCPPAPRETQIGGNRSPLDLVSYTSGYGYAPPSVVSTSSAHYLNQLPYDKVCAGGARRTRRHRSKKGSRRQRRQ